MSQKHRDHEQVVFHARIESRDPLVLAYRAGAHGRVSHSNGGPKAYLTEDPVELVFRGPDGVPVIYEPPDGRIPRQDDAYGNGPLVRLRFEKAVVAYVEPDRVRVETEAAPEVIAGAGALPYPVAELAKAAIVTWSSDVDDPPPHEPKRKPHAKDAAGHRHAT